MVAENKAPCISNTMPIPKPRPSPQHCQIGAWDDERIGEWEAIDHRPPSTPQLQLVPIWVSSQIQLSP